MATTVVVTNKGEEKAIDAIDAFLTTPFIHWGTGTTTAAETDTTLETAASEARVAAAQSQPAIDTLRDVATITCAGAGKAITECGLFDASTSGNMYVRATFDVINVSVGDAIEFTINIQAT